MNDTEHFKNWIASDNVEKTSKGYITQCTSWRKYFTIEKLKIYFINEYGNKD